MSPLARATRRLAPALLAACCAAPATAFNLFPLGPGEALKWGANTVGTPGGLVSWSLIADGTPVAATAEMAALGITGSSQLGTLFGALGGEAAARSLIQAAFASWAALADIGFAEVTEAGALPLGATTAGGASVGQIRIGAYHLGSFAGAVGFAPPPNGGSTLEGDIVFNLDARIGIAPGADGEPYDLYPHDPNDPRSGWTLNDFQGLLAHELGHALGLAHSDQPGALMCGWVSTAFDGSACHWADPDQDGWVTITRAPRGDDIAGIRHLYGPAPVPEPGTLLMLLAGGLALAGRTRRRRGLARPVAAP